MGFCLQTSYTVCMLKRLLQNTPETALLLLTLIPLCVVRILPSLHQPLETLGYDFGFYRYATLHPTLTSGSLFTGIRGGYSHILFYFFHALHIPPDSGLVASLYIAAIALGVALFFILRTHSRAAALCCCLLLACSVIQGQAYSMFLWKTVLALPLVLFGLWAVERKKYVTLAGVLFALLLTHRTSLFILLLTICAYSALYMVQRKRWRLLGLSSLVLGLGARLFHSTANQVWHMLFNPSNSSVAEGIFPINPHMVIVLVSIIALAIYGCKTLLKQNRLQIIMLFTGLCAAWILLRLPFFHRIYIYLDLGLLILSSVGLVICWTKLKNNIAKGALIILGVVLFSVNIYTVTQTVPFISKSEMQEISSFSPSEPAPFVLAVSADDAPWLLGYLQNARLAAPGLFEDTHSESDWQKFWLGEEQQTFLSSFPKPLYIYDRSFKLPGPITHCLTKITPNFSTYTCE